MNYCSRIININKVGRTRVIQVDARLNIKTDAKTWADFGVTQSTANPVKAVSHLYLDENKDSNGSACAAQKHPSKKENC